MAQARPPTKQRYSASELAIEGGRSGEVTGGESEEGENRLWKNLETLRLESCVLIGNDSGVLLAVTDNR